MTPSTLLVIDEHEIIRVLHAEHGLSDLFIARVLARNIRLLCQRHVSRGCCPHVFDSQLGRCVLPCAAADTSE